MATELVHLGFGNILAINRTIAMVSPKSEPIRRMVQEGKGKGLIIDMTNGRRTKAVLIMDSGHIVLAALTPETIAGRVAARQTGLKEHWKTAYLGSYQNEDFDGNLGKEGNGL